MKYFAYGSNMYTNRLRNRVPSCKFYDTGKLNGYTLKFHKRSTDGSGKCNVVPTGNAKDEIVGVVFDFNENEKILLDKAEGRGYRDTLIQVYTSYGMVTAYMYTAIPNFVDNSLIPYTWYKHLVLEGAREHGLPEEYIQKIAEFPAKHDPDLNRDRENREIFPC